VESIVNVLREINSGREIRREDRSVDKQQINIVGFIRSTLAWKLRKLNAGTRTFIPLNLEFSQRI
jgi:hypothetical protein